MLRSSYRGRPGAGSRAAPRQASYLGAEPFPGHARPNAATPQPHLTRSVRTTLRSRRHCRPLAPREALVSCPTSLEHCVEKTIFCWLATQSSANLLGVFGLFLGHSLPLYHLCNLRNLWMLCFFGLRGRNSHESRKQRKAFLGLFETFCDKVFAAASVRYKSITTLASLALLRNEGFSSWRFTGFACMEAAPDILPC